MYKKIKSLSADPFLFLFRALRGVGDPLLLFLLVPEDRRMLLRRVPT